MRERVSNIRERTSLGAGLVYTEEDPRMNIDEHILFRGVPDHVSATRYELEQADVRIISQAVIEE